MGNITGIVCSMLGHRWDVYSIDGQSEWCSRCALRRDAIPTVTASTIDEAMRSMMGSLKEQSMDTQLNRETALQLANSAGGTPDMIVDRAEAYLKFLSGSTRAFPVNEDAVTEIAMDTFLNHQMSAIPTCVAATLEAAVREMVRQANASLKPEPAA